MFDKSAELHDLTLSGALATAWYARRGSGPPLALLPGGPGMASDYLEPVAGLLSDAFEVILIDPPGCGRTPGIELADLYALLEAIDDVRAALGLDQWLMGGHSFGADLALAYALERTRRTLGVLAISPTGVQDDRDWHRAYEAGRAAGRDEVAQSRFPIDTETYATGLAAWRHYIKQPGLLRRIADLQARYVAVVGSEEIRPSWPVEQVAMLAPRGEVVIIDGAGHCPWWTHPTELREAGLRLTMVEPSPDSDALASHVDVATRLGFRAVDLSRAQVAAESGATADEIDRFVEVGIIRPSTDGALSWGDVQRVRAVKQFLDAGVAWKHMERAVEEGLITFDYADAFYLEPAGPSGRTYEEYRTQLGPLAVHLPRVYDTLGLAEPPPDRPMRQDEERCLAGLIDLWTRVGEQEALLRATRLMGDHIRAMVEGWMGLWTEHMRYVGVDTASLQARADLTLELGRGLTDLLPRIMVWAEQRYLEQAMTEVGVEQMEEALAARGIAPAPAERLPAVLFVDLVGFSRLTEERGDEAAVAFGTRLRDVTDAAARRHRGKLVKLLGDGAMLHFADPDDAIAAGLSLLTTGGWHQSLPEPHMGLHAGPVIERDGDLFGTTVNVAARLSGVAGPREFIASAEAAGALTRPLDITLQPLGELPLRNISRPIRAVRVMPAAAIQAGH